MKTKFSMLIDRKARRGNLNHSKGTETRKKNPSDLPSYHRVAINLRNRDKTERSALGQDNT